MMPAPVLDDVTIDPDLLRELDDLNGRVECSFSGCDNEAISLLKCPCGIGSETMCVEHTVYVRVVQATADHTVTITFDKTCLHEPAFVDCAIVPLGG